MITPNLYTERLLLRPITEKDVFAVFHGWMQEEEVSRYMYRKASKDIRDAEDFVHFEREKIPDGGWYRWLIADKQTEKVLGNCLIYYDEEQKSWDISYNLAKEFWGRGYATEAMRAVMRFAVEELLITECIAVHARENPASGRVIEKLGFSFEREVPFVCGGGEIHTIGRLYRFRNE